MREKRKEKDDAESGELQAQEGKSLEKVLDQALHFQRRKQQKRSKLPEIPELQPSLDLDWEQRGSEDKADSDVLDEGHAEMLRNLERASLRKKKRDRGGPAENLGAAGAVADAADVGP